MTLRDAIDATKILGVRLVLLLLASLSLAALASDGSPIREALCAGPGVCAPSTHAAYWNKLFYDLGLACAVSIFFYWLLVRWPEHQRRMRTKRSFAIQYRAFKLGCIDIFLSLNKEGYAYGLEEELLDFTAFNAYFRADLGDRDTRWYRAHNNLDEYYLRALTDRMAMFREEISLVLGTIDIVDEETLDFFKRLSRLTYSFRNASTDYDSVKSLFGFLWPLFTGWDVIYGYTGRDFVADMIERI